MGGAGGVVVWVDVGVEEGEEFWEWVCGGEEAEGFLESSVVSEGLVEVFGGFGDDA